MEASIDQRTTHRVWIPAVIAMLLSIASAFSYFGYVGQGIIVGALLDLPGRESDVAIAQHWAIYWLVASLCCLTGSIATAALALPIYSEASRSSRFIARFVVGLHNGLIRSRLNIGRVNECNRLISSFVINGSVEQN
jgi:hypothetical protein